MREIYTEESERPVVRQYLRIGEQAPAFTARTTMGVKSLDDYRGKWLVLFSHPADFTPVCTSEFIAFENAAKEFRRRDCELLGLSVDSIFAHLAWMQNIEDKFGVAISFPIIEDLSMVIAEAYGMINESSTSTATVRSAFFIDPDGIVRALVHYPMTVGRSVDEILRVLCALQATAEDNLAAPEGWKPGERLLKAPPITIDSMKRRLSADVGEQAKDWYYSEALE
ncbi:peroxiredoxin [Emcibacter sp.]|uniref:peroxiredoxin n=1 Tax=Emcibacter sp. TaxID=1979954 RepID=UPI002AA92B08|nr:peroxiredoxin [Emcibacter sp.]